ncbi:MAG: hypothetical protein R3E53_01400 [Myxococcota bacterium]
MKKTASKVEVMTFELWAACWSGLALESIGSFKSLVVTSTRNQWSFSVMRSPGTIVLKVQSKGVSSSCAGGGFA